MNRNKKNKLMNKSVTTIKLTHKCMHVEQAETFPMTAQMRVDFYPSILILILNLNKKSNDKLKPQWYIIES